MVGINGLYGKLIFYGGLRLKTGLHIGASKDFSAIGAVDTVVVRDPLTRRPYIPGSSVKGKMRYLLARIYAREGRLADIKAEDIRLRRLFGCSGGGSKDNGQDRILLSRLQFQDIFMTEESAGRLEKMDTDLYLTEIKFENSIDRLTAVANPRQLERVPAGAEFSFRLVYNVENPDELVEDMRHLGYGFTLLEDDYIGGHGSRGYGRIEVLDIKVDYKDYARIAGKEPLDIKSLAEQAFWDGRNGVVA
ncbi:type III-A CRISPR-associated RAMP protein Csm3 [Thermincola potens]|uniref:CRISPR system Cms endoribonuclease Csm3 n=1 Tax=Thermincola potens (strain JR) TaxID=635013 RepID=D5X8I9_THEPJ|nr:type III-A CRISPR-associated RAMP protein Csm3 [Thermincola potens]ADG82865.1 CRISPR-associated RAMP protein, Csm3 family [Thermincola potens JR]